MMSQNLFQGNLVRLAAVEPVEIANAFFRWKHDMDYYLPLDSEPPTLFSLHQHKNWEEKWLENPPSHDSFFFGIRTTAEDKLIGFIAAFNIAWQHGDCLIAIGIGEADYRSKGYGTEAMRLMLAFCFNELNLRRVSLIVYDFNQRAQRSYHKNGFVIEGKIRDAVKRDGQRWSWIVMGVLREEWQALETGGKA